MKKFVIGLVIGIIRPTTITAIASQGISIYVNGNLIQSDVPAFVQNGRTMVPLRFVAEALGAQVKWDDATQSIYITTQQNQQSTTTTGQKPPLTATGKGVTITLLSVQANGSGTTLRVRVINNSSVDVNFPASLTQIVAGNTQFDQPSDWDLTFADALRPGVSKEGFLHFPALPSGTNNIRVYMKAWVGKALDTFETTFTVQL